MNNTKTYEVCDCSTCTRQNCPHRDAFRRLPRNMGGLDLCPGHVTETVESKEEEKKAEKVEKVEKAEAEAVADTDSDTVTLTLTKDQLAKIYLALVDSRNAKRAMKKGCHNKAVLDYINDYICEMIDVGEEICRQNGGVAPDWQNAI